jgi:hypothetical protein
LSHTDSKHRAAGKTGQPKACDNFFAFLEDTESGVCRRTAGSSDLALTLLELLRSARSLVEWLRTSETCSFDVSGRTGQWENGTAWAVFVRWSEEGPAAYYLV